MGEKKKKRGRTRRRLFFAVESDIQLPQVGDVYDQIRYSITDDVKVRREAQTELIEIQ